MAVKTHLLIDNVVLKILRGKDLDTGHYYKELVIGYKTIYINTYIVKVVDLASVNNNNTVFKHESFHVWEQPIEAIIASKNKDIITISSSGISLMTMSSHDKRELVDENK